MRLTSNINTIYMFQPEYANCLLYSNSTLVIGTGRAGTEDTLVQKMVPDK